MLAILLEDISADAFLKAALLAIAAGIGTGAVALIRWLAVSRRFVDLEFPAFRDEVRGRFIAADERLSEMGRQVGDLRVAVAGLKASEELMARRLEALERHADRSA